MNRSFLPGRGETALPRGLGKASSCRANMPPFLFGIKKRPREVLTWSFALQQGEGPLRVADGQRVCLRSRKGAFRRKVDELRAGSSPIRREKKKGKEGAIEPHQFSHRQGPHGISIAKRESQLFLQEESRHHERISVQEKKRLIQQFC